MTSLLVVAAGAAALVATAPPPGDAAKKRFVGFVGVSEPGKGTRPSRSVFSPEETFEGLFFVDRVRARTRYRVCWRHDTASRWSCTRRVTGARGTPSRVSPNNIGDLGNYSVRWRVGGRVVATWRFDIVMG